MPKYTNTPLDHHDLARLLSGTTGDEERQRLLSRLAADPDARILLGMAMEALQAAEAGFPRQERRDRRAA